MKPLQLLSLLILMTVGCGPAPKIDSVAADLNKTNIQRVATAFTAYAFFNGMKSPQSKEEIVEFVRTSDKIDRTIKAMGIDRNKFDEVFVSSVDGEEFIVRYESKIREMGGAVPIAFEKTGVDGIRRVGLSNGKIIDADEATYKRLMKGKTSKGEKGLKLQEEDAE